MLVNILSGMGTHHFDVGSENQDAVCYGHNREFSVISLADGVSACEEARCGAHIASRAITDLLLKKGEHFLEFEEKQIAELALSHILCELRRKAAEDFKEIYEYSSTIASVLYDEKRGRMLCFNLGDGIILTTGNGRSCVLAMPADSSSGCCVTTTKNAKSMALAKVFEARSMESALICSDGAWRHMFLKNRLKPEVAALLANREFNGLKEFLEKQDCFDDYSVIVMDLQRKDR